MVKYDSHWSQCESDHFSYLDCRMRFPIIGTSHSRDASSWATFAFVAEAKSFWGRLLGYLDIGLFLGPDCCVSYGFALMGSGWWVGHGHGFRGLVGWRLKALKRTRVRLPDGINLNEMSNNDGSTTKWYFQPFTYWHRWDWYQEYKAGVQPRGLSWLSFFLKKASTVKHFAVVFK